MKFCIFLVLTAIFNACERPPAAKDIDRSAIDRAGNIARYNQLRSSPNVVSMPFELQFIDTMTANEYAVIDLAQLVETRSMRKELKVWARRCLTNRRSELESLAAMRTSMFAASPEAVNIELVGIRDGMSASNLSKADLLKASAFDMEFVKQMNALLNSGAELSFDAAPRISKQTNDDAAKLAEIAMSTNRTLIQDKDDLGKIKLE